MVERRRGKNLESAILSVVWSELQNIGYQSLTISDIAKKAKTNKNTVYRHWKSKPELVFAAIQQHIPDVSLEAPNTGNIEEDLKAVLGFLTPILDVVSKETWKQLLPEALLVFSTNDNYVNGLVKAINESNLITLQIKKVIEQAKKRHEHVRSNITDDQLALPALLVINQILFSGTLTQSKINSLVKEILIPVYIEPA
ncbi:TetR/AcrR family transcriptional regulator [Liquorilactobacillus mali]|nr:TetR/AcrR family transcriptional regulator [Liquorilactobacillus mali]EJE97315.1 Transcriptional regulator, AcrR family protein [Liquorilactobacillus mali KCTC 3596 = DSM 20444]MDC7953138.1 TetR/AcrR family transcriptional regulator [Liquorilactobacillus mali]MDV7757269.1 TetR family transcriptional regulator [Liquorilactobacillus mali]QFQ75309.1 TetR/AcrR family transcriptional regulator [Liquorilactobacillus mali]